MNFYAIARDLPGIPQYHPGVFSAGVYYHVFDSREGRDAWVHNKAEATEYGETREALASNDKDLRRLKYQAARVTDGDSDYDDELYYHYKDEA